MFSFIDMVLVTLQTEQIENVLRLFLALFSTVTISLKVKNFKAKFGDVNNGYSGDYTSWPAINNQRY